MSESGSTRFPNAPSLPERGQTTRDVQARVVELVQAAKEMKEMRDNTRLQGRVERVDNAERRVTLRTERGDIEVKYPKDQPLPKDGERVEITIQNGKNVTIKTIPNTQPDTQDTQTRPSATPVDVIISNSTVETRKTSAPYTPPTSPETTIKPLPQTLPPEGSVVRLTPLPAQELMHVLDPVPIQSLPQTLSAQISFQANLIVQDVQAEMQQLVAPVMIDPQQIALLEAPLQAPLFSQTPTLSAPQNAALPIVLSAPKTESLVSRLFSLPIGLSPAESTAPPMNTAAALSLEPLPLSTMEPVLQETLQAPASSLLLQSAEAPIETLSLFTQTPEPLHVRLEHFEKAQMPFNLPEHLTAEQKASPIPLEQLITQGHRAEVMSARIEGLTKDHLPVLSFPALEGAELQYFTLQAPVESVTPGTHIEMTPQPTPSAIIAGTAVVPPMGSFLSPGMWPLMQEIAGQLQTSSPQLAQVLSNMAPNPSNPAQIMPAALFFIAAIRAGDIGGWLGDKALDILRRDGKGSLLSRLSSEGDVMRRSSSEPLSQNWRALPLPMAWDNEMQKMTLYYRHEGGDCDDPKKQGKQTRFIFDLDLTRMGPVQIDGLFREARLDIILRTETPVSASMREQMRKTYADALRQTQVTGELSFQNQPDQWVKITPDEKRGETVVA